MPYAMTHKLSNPESLKAAVEAAAKVLDAAVRPVLLGGVKVHPLALPEGTEWSRARGPDAADSLVPIGDNLVAWRACGAA